MTEADREFHQLRPRLLGLAYRMLGVLADAEDVVQEAWLRWDRADRGEIASPAAWLTTVTTRLCLDSIRSRERRREDYVGPWLPEPVVLEPGPEEQAEMADSLTLGFLTMLDRLNPVERAVLLLADVFAVPYADVAAAVGKSEVACRQIASRARRRLQSSSPSRSNPSDRAVVDQVLAAFFLGDTEAALARLAPEVVCVSDGGPRRRAARHPIVGPERVARFFTNLAARYREAGLSVETAVINGDPGVVISLDGVIDAVAAFEVSDDRISAIWIVRNPEKLEHVTEPTALT